MQNKPVALVTGATKESVSNREGSRGARFTVLVGSRKLENGETAAKRRRSRCPRPPAQVHESGLDRRRGRALRSEFGRLDVI